MCSLVFDSAFESGNLEQAVRVHHRGGEQEYDLHLSADFNSSSHRQWFYFKMQNMCHNVEYRFNIVNFAKVRFIR